jgi:hypothetical protein
MKKNLIVVFLCFTYFTSNSQSITAQLIDQENKKPVQYATIKTGTYSGVISNEEGFFTIYSKNDNEKTVTISCLGYENKTISIKEIESLKFIIPLKEAINELREVYISNKTPNADSIIAKVKEKLEENYETDLIKYDIFRRTTDHMDFKSLVFEIEKASHVKKKNLEAVNNELNALSKKIKESDIMEFTDFKGMLYSYDKDSSKLTVTKATKLLDYKNDFSMDDIQEKAQKIVLSYLDTTKTYKLKSGMFKIEDSLSLKEDDFKEDEKSEYNLAGLNNNTRKNLRHSQFYKNSFLNKILDTKLYNYTFEDLNFTNNQLTYMISFTPRKGKSKYSGTLFVNDDNYAITRVDYDFYKNRHGSKVNLKFVLGVKYIENVSRGTLIYKKNAHNKYHPKYLKQTEGSYFYVNRDVKFIENSLKKNKVGFSFKLEGDSRNKEELLFTANNKLTLKAFKNVQQDSIITFQKLDRFEKTIWDNEETLEPLEEMKGFGSVK